MCCGKMIRFPNREERKMLTTRQISVKLPKDRIKLNRITTKDIDASIKVELPKKPIKTQIVSTTNLPDIADIAEKKRRDDIMAESKAMVRKAWKDMTDEERKIDVNERMAKARAAKKKK